MKGDLADMVWRLGRALPAKWFPDPADAPVLKSVLNGLGSGLAALYSQITYAGQQTRVATATDAFLDLASLDYLGGSLPRRAGEGDAAFRARILREIIRPRVTRAALAQALLDLTGRAPVIFEPARPTDTGGYGSIGMTAGTGLGYGVAGGYGSLALNNQSFVHAFRATSGGIANVGGYYGGPNLNALAFSLSPFSTSPPNTMVLGSTDVVPYLPGATVAKHTRVDASNTNCGFITPTLPPNQNLIFKVRAWVPSSFSGTALTFTVERTGWAGTLTANLALRDQWQTISAVIASASPVNNTPPLVCRIAGGAPAVGSFVYTTGWEVSAYTSAAGGYGVGAIERASLSMSLGQITDADIYAAAAAAAPAAGAPWVSITT